MGQLAEGGVVGVRVGVGVDRGLVGTRVGWPKVGDICDEVVGVRLGSFCAEEMGREVG